MPVTVVFRGRNQAPKRRILVTLGMDLTLKEQEVDLHQDTKVKASAESGPKCVSVTRLRVSLLRTSDTLYCFTC
jgi:hypothetical protein